MRRLIHNFWENDKGFIWLLVFTVSAIILTQFTVGGAWTEMFIGRLSFFLFTIIAITASVLSRASKRLGYTVAVLLFILAIFLIRLKSPTLYWVYGIVMIAYTVFIVFLLIAQIFGGGKMTLQKIGGGIAVYLLIGHLWSSLYTLVYQFSPDAFLAGGNQIPLSQAVQQLSYFSFVTLTTLGYGDVLAISPMARSLVMIEGLIGQLFPAIFIAKLVSQQIEDSKK